MNNIREIYTKAIIAKGKKLSRNTYNLSLNQIPDKILGCSIMNHIYQSSLYRDIPYINGSFDVHIWYSLGNDSFVEKHTVSYNDEIQVSTKENRTLYEDDSLVAKCLNIPRYLNIDFKDYEVSVEVEKEMLLEVTGETCIRVEVKDENEDWDDIDHIEINPYFIG